MDWADIMTATERGIYEMRISTLKAEVQTKNTTINNLESIIQNKDKQLNTQKCNAEKIIALCNSLNNKLTEIQQSIATQKQQSEEAINKMQSAINMHKYKIQQQQKNMKSLNTTCNTLQIQVHQLECAKKNIETTMSQKQQNWKIQSYLNQQHLNDEMYKCEQLKFQLHQQQQLVTNLKAELEQEKQEHNTLLQNCQPIADYMIMCDQLGKKQSDQ